MTDRRSDEIDAAALTTYDVDPDGAFARLHVKDQAGLPATVKLPTPCLNQLMMTLPQMVQKALRNSHGDASLRLVHSLDDFTLEVATQPSPEGSVQLILTLQTADGFGVSFTAGEDALNALAQAIFRAVPAHSPGSH